MMNQQI